jgi:RNA polymerase subunit RPABC4/transcription elongation factor Spt4
VPQAKPVLYNHCKGCGALVKRGIGECPECQTEITDEYGFGALLMKHPERGIYAAVGLVLGLVPVAIVALLLNDPTVGFLNLSDVGLRTVTLLCLLGGAVTGWFWPGIVQWLRERE